MRVDYSKCLGSVDYNHNGTNKTVGIYAVDGLFAVVERTDKFDRVLISIPNKEHLTKYCKSKALYLTHYSNWTLYEDMSTDVISIFDKFRIKYTHVLLKKITSTCIICNQDFIDANVKDGVCNTCSINKLSNIKIVVLNKSFIVKNEDKLIGEFSKWDTDLSQLMITFKVPLENIEYNN